MSDTRFKDLNWALPLSSDSLRIQSWDHVKIALLMDIRDELKQLNCVLGCSNFQNVPHLLRRISANTAKPRKKVAK